MLFGSKKRTYASSRFQKIDFNKKVALASKYKRKINQKPENRFGRFLFKIGLKTKFSKAIALLGLILLVYIIYIPNFLFVKNIKIVDAEANTEQSINDSVNKYFNSRVLLAQKNLLLLNKNSLKNYILKDNSSILDVVSIKKHLWNSLEIKVKSRKETFLLSTKNKQYVLYNDGIVSREIMQNASQFQGTRVNVETTNILNNGDKFLTPESLNTVNWIIEHFFEKTGKALDYFEFPVISTKVNNSNDQNIQSEEGVLYKEEINFGQIVVNLKRDPKSTDSSRDYKILLNTADQDLGKLIDTLNSVINQLTPDKFGMLFYADMRFKDKAYVCLKGTPCADSFKINYLPEKLPQDVENIEPSNLDKDKTKPAN